jgi:flavin-dependent dehydrogenase
MIDLLIAGSGPVGLVTAIHAAEAGLKVVVIDPRIGAVDKACGEGLMPQAIEHLERIKVNPPGKDLIGIKYNSVTRSATANFSGKPGRGVRRTTLSNHLSQRASELNISFVEGRVTDIEQNNDWVKAAGIKSRYLIGADGLHSTVRTLLNLNLQPKKSASRRYGLRQHFAIEPWSEYVEVYWLPNAELYVTPVDDMTVGIAILGSETVNFWETVSQLPDLERSLRAAKPISKLRGAGPLRQNLTSRTLGRSLLVGDAAGYVDALTGEGMRVGFEEGRVAVQSILSESPSAYEAEWHHITRSYRILVTGLLWASSNHLVRPLIVPAASTLPSVFRKIVNTLG